MSVKSMLNEEIEEQIKELNKTEVGTEMYKTTVEGVTKLIDRHIEMNKLEIESADRRAAMEIEADLKEQQMAEDKKDRKVKNWLTVGGIVIPAATAIWGTVKSINFEKTGTITTIIGRGWIGKLIPKK